MPSHDVSNQSQSFNLSDLQGPKKSRTWVKYGGLAVMVVLAMGVGYWSMEKLLVSDKNESAVRQPSYKIQPLAPKVKNAEEVPPEFGMRGSLFASTGIPDKQAIEINGFSDFARVPGAVELYYNQPEKNKLFFNGQVLNQDGGRVHVTWKTFELALPRANILLNDAVSGDTLDWKNLKTNNVAQIAVEADEKGLIRGINILVL